MTSRFALRHVLLWLVQLCCRRRHRGFIRRVCVHDGVCRESHLAVLCILVKYEALLVSNSRLLLIVQYVEDRKPALWPVFYAKPRTIDAFQLCVNSYYFQRTLSREQCRLRIKMAQRRLKVRFNCSFAMHIDEATFPLTSMSSTPGHCNSQAYCLRQHSTVPAA